MRKTKEQEVVDRMIVGAFSFNIPSTPRSFGSMVLCIEVVITEVKTKISRSFAIKVQERPLFFKVCFAVTKGFSQ